MKLRVYFSLLIFVGSYFPLSIILLAQDFKYDLLSTNICNPIARACDIPFSNPIYSIPIFLVCGACLIIAIANLSSGRQKRRLLVREAKHEPAELINYSLPYVVSFMSIGYDETGKFVGLLVFLGWMFWLSHMSGQTILNPALIAFGWRFHRISYSFHGSKEIYSGIALSNHPLSVGDAVRYGKMDDVFILKKDIVMEGSEQ